MGALAVGEQLQGLIEFGGREVLLIPALLEALGQIGEAGHRRRGRGVLGLVGGVIGGEVRDGLRQRCRSRRARTTAKSTCRHSVWMTGAIPAALIFSLFASNSAQVLGTLKPELLVDLLVVEDAAAHRRAARHAEDLPVLRYGRQERLLNVGDEGLLREVDQRFGWLEGLEQRAGVVPDRFSALTLI